MATDKDTIIEGEIIGEAPTADTNPTPPGGFLSRLLSGKSGWILAGLLFIFLCGAASFPYFKATFQKIGLIPESDSPVVLAPATVPDLSSVEAALVRHQEMLAQLSARVESLTVDVTRLQASAVSGVTSEEFTQLQQALTDMQQQTTQKIQPDGVTITPAALKDLQAKLDAMTAALAASRAEQQQTQDQYESRLAGLETGAFSASPQGRLYLSLSELRGQALKGMAVSSTLAGLIRDERFAGQSEMLASLTKLHNWLQENPARVLSMGQLVTAFNAAARDFIREQDRANGSFLSKLFTVRGKGPGATGDDAALYDAETRLAESDLAGAVAALQALEPVDGDKLSVWVADARHHLAVAAQFDALLASMRGSAF